MIVKQILACKHGRPQEFFRGGAKFEIHSTGTNEDTENRNKATKSVNSLMFKGFKGHINSFIAIYC